MDRTRDASFALAAAVLLLAGAVLRVAGAWNDLWLDEIWAIEVAQGIASPLEVFTGLHHEINHHLSTLWLWAAGDRGNWIGYRGPALAAGIASVAVAGWIGRRRSDAAALCTMAVVGASFPLVLYASEARGYAGCVLAAFLCLALLGRHLESGSMRAAIGYACVAIVGLLSHLIFASVLLAGIAWTLQQARVDRATLRARAASTLLCHLPALLVLTVLYAVDVRHVEAGGGMAAPSRLGSFGAALAWSLGAPAGPRAQLVAAIVALAVLVAGLRAVARTRPDSRVFYVGAIVVFPLLLGFVRESDVLYPRHFLVSIAFLTLLFGHALADLFESRGWRRAVAALALVLFVAAHGAHLATLLRHGRGMPSEALRLIEAQSGGARIVVGADHEFRVGTVLGFLLRGTASAARFDLRPQEAWPPEGPAWILAQKEPSESPAPPGDEIRDGAGRRYVWVATFPSAPLSGLHWFVYRRAELR